MGSRPIEGYNENQRRILRATHYALVQRLPLHAYTSAVHYRLPCLCALRFLAYSHSCLGRSFADLHVCGTARPPTVHRHQFACAQLCDMLHHSLLDSHGELLPTSVRYATRLTTPSDASPPTTDGGLLGGPRGKGKGNRVSARRKNAKTHSGTGSAWRQQKKKRKKKKNI